MLPYYYITDIIKYVIYNNGDIDKDLFKIEDINIMEDSINRYSYKLEELINRAMNRDYISI